MDPKMNLENASSTKLQKYWEQHVLSTNSTAHKWTRSSSVESIRSNETGEGPKGQRSVRG